MQLPAMKESSEGISFSFFSFEEQNYCICAALRATHPVMDATQFIAVRGPNQSPLGAILE